MSNYFNYKIYKNLITKDYIKSHFISKQNIFNNLNKKISISRINHLKQNLNIILFNLLNLICQLKISSKNLSTIHYWIPDPNSNNFIDERSKYFLNRISSQINLVRTNSLFFSLRLLFTLPNVIFLTGFQKIYPYDYRKINNNLKFRCSFYEKNERRLCHNLQNFFLNQRIKKLISIDDYRIIQTLLFISKKLKIHSIAYQHGRFEKSQYGLMGSTFDKFYVWSNFFKKKLITINKKYSKKNLIIGNFRFKKLYTKKNARNILYICEQNIPINKMIKDIKILVKNSKDQKIKIRLREKQIYPKKFLLFLNSEEIFICREKTLSKSILNNEIKYLIAYSSTALLESSLYNVFPLMPVNNKYYSNEYAKEKIVFKIDNLDQFDFSKKNYFFKKNFKNLKKIQKKLWN